MPRTTPELLDIASNHADGEEAVAATLKPAPSRDASRRPWRGDVHALQKEEEEERQAPS
jgi:hypothetical protein